jgi:hypothetical protein
MTEIKFKSNFGKVTMVVKDASGLEWLDTSVVSNFYNSAFLVNIKQYNKTYTTPMSNVISILVEAENG